MCCLSWSCVLWCSLYGQNRSKSLSEEIRLARDHSSSTRVNFLLNVCRDRVSVVLCVFLWRVYVDEFAVQQLKEFNENTLKSASKEILFGHQQSPTRHLLPWTNTCTSDHFGSSFLIVFVKSEAWAAGAAGSRPLQHAEHAVASKRWPTRNCILISLLWCGRDVGHHSRNIITTSLFWCSQTLATRLEYGCVQTLAN